jgi:hypothetical protein
MTKLNPNQSLDSLWPSRFLKPFHLMDNGFSEITDTIKEIRLEETEPRPGEKRQSPVLYFERVKTPYLLSAKSDRDTLHHIFGVRTIGQLVGLRITLHVTEWQRHVVLRIKPVKPPAPKPAPVATPDASGDKAHDAAGDAHDTVAGDESDDNHAPTQPVDPAPPA